MFIFSRPKLPKKRIYFSVADPDPGSGIRCLFAPWIRDSGWVKIEIRICDEHPGSYFRELRNSFLVENTSILLWGSGSGYLGSGIFLTACIRDRKIRITDLFLIFFSHRLVSDQRFPRYRENKLLPDRLSAPGTFCFN